MRRGIWLVLAAVVLAGVGAGVWFVRRNAPAAPVEQAAPAPATGREITLTGNIAPRDAVPIPSPLAGVLEVLDIPLGGEVLMGQILAHVVNMRTAEESDSLEEQLMAARDRMITLEGQEASARLEATRASAEAAAAEANMEQTKAAADRQELLFKEGVAPRNSAEQARKEATAAVAEHTLLRESARAAEERAGTVAADLAAVKDTIEMLEAAIEAAAENLRMGEVISPMDGILIATKYLPGDAIPADTKDLLHVAPSALRLAVALEPDPATLAQLASLPPEGAVARITLESQPDSPLAGRLVKTADGQWQAQLDVTEPLWKPGEVATVTVRLP